MKYGNKITKIDGYKFHSKKEAYYYLYLKSQLTKGFITSLELQPIYPIEFHGHRICKVILDFKYKDRKTGEVHHIDVKGYDTAMSKLRRKLVEAQYGFKVVLI